MMGLVKALELRIPPVIVTLVIGGAMWVVAHFTPALASRGTLSSVGALTVSIVGLAMAVAGDISFQRARTSINPMKPGNASSLVTGGIYRYTRNPMYVGLLFFLVGWAIYLLNVWVLPGPVAFVAYMTRFQIIPEERVLAPLFGEKYTAYTARVRRWL